MPERCDDVGNRRGLRGRVIELVMTYIWLAYLFLPGLASLTADISLAAKGALLVGVLVFLYFYYRSWAIPFTERRARLVILAAAYAVALVLALGGGNEGWQYLFVYVGVMAGFWDPPGSVALVIVTAATALGVATIQGTGIEDQLLLGFLTLTTGLGMVGVRAMMQQNDELRLAREEVAKLAVAEERLRFARDLHDLLGHSLSVIVLKAELAGKMAGRDPARMETEVHDIERVARQALREVREAVSGYRQPSLSQALETARATLEGAGLSVRMNLEAQPGAVAAEGTLAWAVREATTNVIRHSGAHRVVFGLRREGPGVVLSVIDDGRGGAVSEGNGLRGLRERIAASGGQLRFGPAPESGFELAVTVPAVLGGRGTAVPSDTVGA